MTTNKLVTQSNQRDTHHRLTLRSILSVASLSLCLFSGYLVAQDQQAVAKQIEALEAEINAFKAQQKKTKADRSELEKTLEKNEKAINQILKKVKQIETKLEGGEEKLSALFKQQQQLAKKKIQQQDLIGEQVRASYELGQQQYLKMLLNLEDPSQVSRILTYYDYFNRARSEQIQNYETVLTQLGSVEADIVTQQDELQLDKRQFDMQKADLLKVRKQRSRTLAALTKEIQSTARSITKRQEDRKQLDSLLNSIAAGIINLEPPKDAVPFTKRKGKMLLPVAGKMLHRFGHKRNNGKLKWNGVFIKANLGEPVNAVHYGQVVFADWLRGFGLLMIVNHGQGYLSLYGHNQVLYRQVGDWVTAGDVIADVGDSGGQVESGLYFEIRRSGKPSDPQQWCRSRPNQAKRA